MFVFGLSIAMRASKNLSPEDVAKFWPQHVPLLPNDFDDFAEWFANAADRCRERYPDGNDAALQAAE
jgi:hypothetical protein